MPDQNQRTKAVVKERTGNSSHFDAGKSLRDGAPSSEEKKLPEVSPYVSKHSQAAADNNGLPESEVGFMEDVTRISLPVSLWDSP
ncbi:hypothetical protein STEG23_005276 [Scotinomys teguina]